MNLIEKLEALTAEARTNGEAFFGKNNKTAGTRLRKNLQDIKNLCTEGRKTVTDTKNAK